MVKPRPPRGADTKNNIHREGLIIKDLNAQDLRRLVWLQSKATPKGTKANRKKFTNTPKGPKIQIWNIQKQRSRINENNYQKNSVLMDSFVSWATRRPLPGISFSKWWAIASKSCTSQFPKALMASKGCRCGEVQKRVVSQKTQRNYRSSFGKLILCILLGSNEMM